MKAASIDLGTNTFRLLAIQVDKNSSPILTILYQDRKIVRMGEGLAATGKVTPQAQERALAALKDFKKALEEHGIDRIFVAATSVFREAQNAQTFLEKAREVLGVPIQVVSGEEEARLTLLGGLWNLKVQEGILFDIGGGSTEFIRFRERKPVNLISTPLGVVKLTESLLHHDPPTPQEMETLERVVTIEVKKVAETLGNHPLTLVGTAGTVTTLAAIDIGLSIYDHSKVHGHVLTRGRIEEMLKTFLVSTREERLKMKGMERGREDLIIPGTIITLKTMEVWDQKGLVVSDLGLREGVLLDGLGCR